MKNASRAGKEYENEYMKKDGADNDHLRSPISSDLYLKATVASKKKIQSVSAQPAIKQKMCDSQT